jgi:AraC-like DNA-binding protein
MLTLQTSLYAVAITSCLFYLFILGRAGARKPGRAYRYLIAYVALECAGFLLEWLMVHPTSPGKSLWLGLLMASSFLVAPCLWLFAREITEDVPPSLRKVSRLHFAVIGLGVALTLPLIQRAYWGPHFGDPSDVASPQHLALIHTSMFLCATLFLVQVPFYLRACLRILTTHREQSKALLSTIEPQLLNALRLLIAIVCANWIVSLLRVLHCIFLGKDTGWGIVFALLEVAVSVVAVFTLARRAATFTSEDRELALAEAKYAKSSLDSPTRARIRRKLDAAFAEQRLHFDNRLTLRLLCQQIRENAHYVSQVINQDLQTNFYDLVNGRRVESAKAALALYPEKSVLEIALEVGFNSKSTFNTAFRQHAGTTPTKYRHAGREPTPDSQRAPISATALAASRNAPTP